MLLKVLVSSVVYLKLACVCALCVKWYWSYSLSESVNSIQAVSIGLVQSGLVKGTNMMVTFGTAFFHFL